MLKKRKKKRDEKWNKVLIKEVDFFQFKIFKKSVIKNINENNTETKEENEVNDGSQQFITTVTKETKRIT